MSKRSRAREIALQMLYQQDLNPGEMQATDAFLAKRLTHPELIQFAKSLILGVLRNRDELDEMLAGLAENWSLKRMAVTDRNIMRLGAYEILFTETPGPVVVNEAVELAKRYGAKQSAQFVNGILDRILQQQRQ